MRPALLLLTATTFWGLNFHLAKIMLQYVHFLEAGFWRYLLGVGFLLIQRKRLHHTQVWEAPKGIFLVGLIGLFGFNLLFFIGLQYTSAINAALIMSLNPLFTLLLANRILKSPIYKSQKTGMIISLVGVVYLLSEGKFQQLLTLQWDKGDVFILGANLLFALHHVWVKKYAPNFDNLTFTVSTNFVCLLGFIFFSPFIGQTPPPLIQIDFWSSAVGIGVFGTGVAYLFWNLGIQKIGAATAGLYMNIVPLTAALFGMFFGENVENHHLISSLFILSGLYIVRP